MTVLGAREHVELRSGAYADSVTLLDVSRRAQQLPGVAAAQVAMATPLNVEVLASMGFQVPVEATPNDMVLAVRLTDEGELAAVLDGIAGILAAAARRPEGGAAEVAPARTTASALRQAPDGVVLVSVPGEHAFVEAMDAVDAGRDVMVFSDNVTVAEEIALKRAAARTGSLMMGPDCGTAVVDGIGLGFANVVPPGPVGIVAASGTGTQQLLTLLDHAGVGVTAALGVGGRDLSAEVGGLSTRVALQRLDADPRVELVVLVSKPPAAEVADALRETAGGLRTPVQFALLGEPAAGASDLTTAVEAVLRALGREVPTWPVHGTARPASGGRWLRGLFAGGTLCDEAMLIARGVEPHAPIRSNIPFTPEEAIGPDLTAAAHTFVDFGDDALTVGRAHPMIDPTLRLEHLRRAATDPETAVLLLDVVLGHGADPDPAATLAPGLAQVDRPVVVSLVGSAGDPQDLDRQRAALVEAGAEVHLSNAAATRRAIDLLGDTTEDVR